MQPLIDSATASVSTAISFVGPAIIGICGLIAAIGVFLYQLAKAGNVGWKHGYYDEWGNTVDDEDHQ